MKKFKKIAIITALALGVSAGALFTGVKIGASNINWVDQIIRQANSGMAQTAANKTEQLLADDSISGQMKIMLDPEIEAQEKELERLLEEYYRMKLDGLTDTDEFKAVQDRIGQIKQTTLEYYKKEIDAAFAG